MQPTAIRTARAALIAWAIGACSPTAEPPRAPPNGAADPEPIDWSLPQGWRREVIRFPLEFAPDIAYRGAEVIRFAPRFFDASAPTYFSYAFAWVLDGAPALEPRALESDLARYFAGLCAEVGGAKFHFDPARFRAHLEPAEARRPGARALGGAVDAYDPFGDGRALTLNVRIEIWDCPAPGPRVAAFAASPAPPSAPIWRELDERLAALRCK